MAAGIANRPRSQEGVSAGQRAILMSRRVSGGGLAHLGHTPSTSGFSPSRCVSRALSSANVRSRSVRRFVQRGNAGHDLQPADRDSIGLAHPHHGSSGSPPWGCSVTVGQADRAPGATDIVGPFRLLHAQAPQRRIESATKVAPGRAEVVGTAALREASLRGDHDLRAVQDGRSARRTPSLDSPITHSSWIQAQRELRGSPVQDGSRRSAARGS